MGIPGKSWEPAQLLVLIGKADSAEIGRVLRRESQFSEQRLNFNLLYKLRTSGDTWLVDKLCGQHKCWEIVGKFLRVSFLSI